MTDNRPHENKKMFNYFDLQIYGDEYTRNIARFNQHKITGQLYIFQFNCGTGSLKWNERGYGWGHWVRLPETIMANRLLALFNLVAIIFIAWLFIGK